MSKLSAHFEKLDQAINQLEAALDQKAEQGLDVQSEDQSEELDQLKEKNALLSRQIGTIVSKVERMIASVES